MDDILCVFEEDNEDITNFKNFTKEFHKNKIHNRIGKRLRNKLS